MIQDTDLDIFHGYMPSCYDSRCSTHIPVYNLVDYRNIATNMNMTGLRQCLYIPSIGRTVTGCTDSHKLSHLVVVEAVVLDNNERTDLLGILVDRNK